MKTATIIVLLLTLFVPTAFAGPLADKAADYAIETPSRNRPGYGAIVDAHYTDDTLTVYNHFGGRGDSTIWTGTYLGAVALRYMVTGDPDAYDEMLSAVDTLHHHLKVTGRTGFIARYRGPNTYPYNAGCETDEHCYHGSGDYIGDIFITNTSRDQYTGWFFGMGMAYDAISDPAMRQQIADDIAEVIDALMAQNWTILDLDGVATTKAPRPISTYKANWTLIAAHVTGEQRFWDEYRRLTDPGMTFTHKINSIAFINKYVQHYGNNLNHTNFFMLMRLSWMHGLWEDYAFWTERFITQVHRVMHLVHNPWYETVHWSILETPNVAMRNQIIDDLTKFPAAPNVHYEPDQGTYDLDPFSVWLHDFQQQNPWLADLIGSASYQALEPFPLDKQCNAGFIFQRSSFKINCGADQPTRVNPGADYLVAYWMARYHDVIDETY